MDILSPLTYSEKVVLSCLVEGMGNAEIAAETGLKNATVREYICRMMKKYGRKNRTDLAVFAVTNSILSQCHRAYKQRGRHAKGSEQDS